MAESPLVRFFQRLVSRPVAVFMLVLAVLGMGLIAAARIPIELQPSGFASSRIWVSAPWSGANPQELEKQVILPLEEELRTVRGVKEFYSYARQGSGGVVVSFPGSMDMDLAYAEVADRVERVRPRLPREVDRVQVRRWTTADTPVLWCGVMYPPEEAEAAQDTLKEVFQPRIEAVDGVANVNLFGIEPRSVRIWLDEDRVTANNVDIGALITRLSNDNTSVPVGDLDDSGSRFIVRVDGRFNSLEEIENFPIRQGLTLKDVGRVVLARSAPESLFRVNGQYGVGMAVTKESSANTFEVCQAVKKLVREEIPDDPILGQFEYKVFWNAGQAIENSLRGLVEDAALGGGIACVVLMVFLRRLRYTLLIALSIPFSVIVTLAYLYFSGDSFNLFSMMGITISIGMLVDNSVVIVESIFKRREQGTGIQEAVTRGPAEVMLAVITATLTTVVVFMPLIFMSENRNARLFTTSIGIPLCVSLLAALVLAIVIVPVASRYLTRTHQQRTSAGGGFFERLGLTRGLVRLVDWSLHNRISAALIAGLFFYSGIAAGAGNEVRDNLAGFGGEMEIEFEFAANTTLSAAEKEVIAMEEALLPLRAEIGDPTIGVDFNRREGQINLWYDVELTSEEEKEVYATLEERLPRRAAVEFQFDNAFDRQNTEDEEWNRVAIEGPDSEVVARIAEQIRALARNDDYYEKVGEEDDPNREVLLSLDREQMQRLGTNSQSVLGIVEWTLRGFMVSRMQTDRTDIPIIVEYDEPDYPNRARLGEMPIAGFDSGASVPLAAIASLDHQLAPRSIFRQNGKTTDVVGLKPRNKDLRSNAAHLQGLLSEVHFPEGYRWNQSGGWQRFQDDMSELENALILAVCLVFFLMGLLFESLLLPISVLFTIPFAIAGANWAFFLTDTPMDIIGMIGMIVLAGVVVNNGIVLVDRIIRLRHTGLPRRDAVLQGVQDRVRPVLMTAMTTITGLLPIALSKPDGNGFSFQGLAIGVAGGLAFTTVFTLWVVPLAYSLLDDLGIVLMRFARFRRKTEETPAPVAGAAQPG